MNDRPNIHSMQYKCRDDQVHYLLLGTILKSILAENVWVY